MSTPYSPSGTYPSFPITLPNDGEIVNFAVLCVAILEPIIDAIGVNAARTWIAAQTFTSITANANYHVSSRTETRMIPVEWVPLSGFVTGPITSVDGGTAGVVVGKIYLPNAQTITGISVFITPIAHGALPAVMPKFELFSYAPLTNTTSAALLSKTDASLLGTYVGQHEVAATSLSIVPAPTTLTYYIAFTGESGANSEIDLSLRSVVKLVYTRTIVGED